MRRTRALLLAAYFSRLYLEASFCWRWGYCLLCPSWGRHMPPPPAAATWPALPGVNWIKAEKCWEGGDWRGSQEIRAASATFCSDCSAKWSAWLFLDKMTGLGWLLCVLPCHVKMVRANWSDTGSKAGLALVKMQINALCVLNANLFAFLLGPRWSLLGFHASPSLCFVRDRNE